MIVVKVEMWPMGSEARKREIGRTYIANVGGSAKRGDYKGAVCRRGTTAIPLGFAGDNPGPEPTREGTVEDYPRLSYNMWRLVIRMLLACFPEEKPKRQ